MFEEFTPHNFNAKTASVIMQANTFLADYEAQGYNVTLRQLYYKFVSNVEGFENSLASYKRFGAVISKARLAGQISWTSIVDNARTFKGVYVEERLAGSIENISNFYAPDLWQDQINHVEVWVEKDALADVVSRPCKRWKVPYMACKGYMSSSEMWSAAHRFRRAHRQGRDCVLIHLGDHDPSGIDMTRDNVDRLSTMFADVEIKRVALNMDQIEEYSPPPNPTKITDSRAESYISEFGHESWELDALEPRVIDRLLDGHIQNLIDNRDLYDERKADTEKGRQVLEWIGENSHDVIDWATDRLNDE